MAQREQTTALRISLVGWCFLFLGCFSAVAQTPKPKPQSPLVIDHSKHSPEEEAGPKVTIVQPKPKDTLFGKVKVEFKVDPVRSPIAWDATSNGVESVVPITDCE